MADAWIAFRDFVERTEDLPVSMLVRRACLTDPGTRSPPRTTRRFRLRLEGRAAVVPADPADLHPTCPGPRRDSACRRAARRRAADARAVGGLGPDPDAGAGRRFAEAIGAPEPRPSRPPRTSSRRTRRGDRAPHRRLARRLIRARRAHASAGRAGEVSGGLDRGNSGICPRAREITASSRAAFSLLRSRPRARSSTRAPAPGVTR